MPPNNKPGALLLHFLPWYKTEKDNIEREKGKVIPLLSWTGPEGSRRLRLPDFKTVGT